MRGWGLPRTQCSYLLRTGISLGGRGLLRPSQRRAGTHPGPEAIGGQSGDDDPTLVGAVAGYEAARLPAATATGQQLVC